MTLGSSTYLLAALASALLSCGRAPATPPSEDIIACRLDALTPADRAHEQTLLREHRARYRAVTERGDGFEYRYPADAALFARMAELVVSEHRCCPFLDFELRWRGADDAPSLTVSSARAKDFITGTFGTAR